ncbi:MAG: TfoX/Sxy family protein [Planctomycetes bacterium]|nr:TfoX/Sxy family protein [Planctomycetota bacterium]
MPYSESLAERIRRAVAGQHGIEEKKMFGGIGFLLRGNMCVGVWKDSLVARLGPEQASEALRQPFVADFDITGRPMKGWVVVTAEGVDDDEQLKRWIERAASFVATLPAK